jgi:hypothetical protein
MAWRHDARPSRCTIISCCLWLAATGCSSAGINAPPESTDGAPPSTDSGPPGSNCDGGAPCSPDPSNCEDITCGQGDVCSGGFCVSPLVDQDGDGFLAYDDCDDREPSVYPGVSISCESCRDDTCLEGYRVCSAGGTWTPCSAPDNHGCGDDQIHTEDCGKCGIATRNCADRLWADLGSCHGAGPCQLSAVEVRSCGVCRRQQRQCQADCQWDEWGDCLETSECEPTSVNQPCTTHCGTTGSRDCTTDCVWGTCQPPREADSESCQDGLDNDCDGATDCADSDCAVQQDACSCQTGDTRQSPCSNCGTVDEVCNAVGEWQEEGPCQGQGQGACNPGESQRQKCGYCQQRLAICTDSCTWGDWGNCEPHQPLAECTDPCGGARTLNHCWYLAAPGASCNETCTSHGGFDEATITVVGTASQGGGLTQCTQVMQALGKTNTTLETSRGDSLGLGCHVWRTDQYWVADPPFNPDHSASSAQPACGCWE